MQLSIQIPPGLQRGATPYDSPDRWWDCNLVRWQDGTLRPIGGWERTTSSSLDSAVREIHVWRDNTAVKQTLIGTDNKLYIDNSGAWVDITPSGFTPLSNIGVSGGYGISTYSYGSYGTPRPASNLYNSYAFWSMGNWGQDVILTANSDGFLYYYSINAPTTAPVKITATSGTTPTGNNAVIVTEERHVMAIAANGDPRRIAWSSAENYQDWNFASTTNTAGYLDVSSEAPLLYAVKVREGVLVFSQTECYLVRYVGLPFIYGADRHAECSLMSPKCVAEHSGSATWMGKGGFWNYVGGVITPLACPIANDVFTEMDPVYGPYRAFAANHGIYPEVWFYYPTAGSTEWNKAVIYNYASGAWYWARLSRSAMFPAGTFKYPIMGTSDGNIYNHEVGYLDAGSSRVGQVWIESGMVASGNGDRSLEVGQAMLGSGHGYDSMSFTAYSRMTPEGSERTFGPYAPRSNGYTDTRISGRDIRVRLTATKDEEWSVGKMRLDVASGAGR